MFKAENSANCVNDLPLVDRILDSYPGALHFVTHTQSTRSWNVNLLVGVLEYSNLRHTRHTLIYSLQTDIAVRLAPVGK